MDHKRLSLFDLMATAMKIAGLTQPLSERRDYGDSGEHTGVIRKEKGKYCVKSEKNPNWNGGCYDSKEKAKERLQDVEAFKHMKGK